MMRNIISAFFTRGFVAVCNLGVLLITSRELGSTALGEISMLIVNITVIQTLIEIYTGPAIVHFIPGNDLRHIYRKGILWILGGVLLLNALFLLLGLAVPGLAGQRFSGHLPVLSFLASLNAFHNVVLLGRERIAAYNFQVFLQPAVLLLTLSISVFLLEIMNANANIIALYFSWGISVLVSAFLVGRLLKRAPVAAAEFPLRAILKNGLINQLGNLAHILSNRYNYYMLAAAALVGVYASATSLIESAWIISASISPLVLSHVANRQDSGSTGKITFMLAKISFGVSALCVLVIMLLPDSFFTFLLGKDFAGARSLMLNLAPGVLFLSFSSILSHYFSALGRQKILLAANLSGFVVTLATSYFLISRYGMYGACYAATLSYFTQFLIITVTFMRGNRLSFLSLFKFERNPGTAAKG